MAKYEHAGRPMKPDYLKAHNWTIKVYGWEKEPIKEYIKKLRVKNDKI